MHSLMETELVEERAKNAMLQAELVSQQAETTSAQKENAQLPQQVVSRLRGLCCKKC
jgi:hypothetical protein